MLHKRIAMFPAKRTSYCILATIALMLVSFMVIYYFDIHADINDKMVINLLDKQSKDIHKIKEDADLLRTLIFYRNSREIKENTSRNISDIKNDINTARIDYENTWRVMDDKHITYQFHNIRVDSVTVDKCVALEKIDNLWSKFDEKTQIVINSDTASPDLLNAFEYIDSSSENLVKLSYQFHEQFLYKSIHKDQIFEYCEFGMIILLSILLLFYLFYLHRFILIPYNQLYKGITDIGLTIYPTKQKSTGNKKKMSLTDEVKELFLKINNLISLIENINNNNSFMETLTYISETFSDFIAYNYIGIALINADKKTLKASYGVSDGTIVGLPEKIMGVSWPIKDTSLGPLFESGEARIINDLEKYCEGNQIKPYNKTLLEAGVRASIALPLKASGEPVGIIFFSSKDKDVYNQDHLKILGTLANSIAISLNQNILANDIQYSSVLALANLSEARDEDTGEHMERMKKYSRTIAMLLYENQIYPEEITIEYIDMIERFSPLHDIGKVGIMDDILLKPAKLTPEEFNEMKKHTLFGAQVLKSADMNMQKKGKSVFGMGIEIAEGHHERWDGSGYPYKKMGTEIPLSARIAAIADVFDALTSKRPYKNAFPLDKSFEIIEQGRGTHFDPTIIDVILKNKKRIEDIYYKYNN